MQLGLDASGHDLLPSRTARQLSNAGIDSPAAEADADAEITVVSTARELQAALASGAQDVEVRAHLDLSDLALAHTSNTTLVSTALGDVKPSTRSVRVSLKSSTPGSCVRVHVCRLARVVTKE